MTPTFKKLINDYNEDYLALLQRASKGDYQRLLFSFVLLKDLYDALQMILDQDTEGPQVLPYPFWFRGNETFLDILGFNSEQIQNIFGFLDYVEATRGKTFEDCLAERQRASQEAESIRVGS
jgi:hypothetical protein